MNEYIIDSHAHLDGDEFFDRDEIINKFKEDKVYLVINPAVDLDSSEKAIELSKKYKEIYAMVGTHPHEAKYYNESTRDKYKNLLKYEKVVAVGEIGLDYHYDFSPKNIQKEVFINQIKMARELNKPIVIHSREAFEDTYNILKENALKMKVLLHSFNESWEDCKKYLELGFYISLGGMITFKNAKNLVEVVKKVPIDRLLLETDSPYLTPHPYRGRRNEPKYTHYVAKKVSEIRNLDLSYVREITNKNTLKFFGIKYGKD